MTKQLENTILFSYFKNIDQNHSWNLITTMSYGILIMERIWLSMFNRNLKTNIYIYTAHIVYSVVLYSVKSFKKKAFHKVLLISLAG